MHGVGGDANKAGDSDRLEGDKDPLSAFNWGPLPIHQQLSANFIFGDNNYLQQQQQQQHHLNSYIHYHSYPSAETTTTPFGGGNYPFPPDNLSPIDHHYHYNNNIGNSTTTTTTTANILDFKKPPLSIATSSSSSSSYSSSNSTLKDKDALSAAIMMSSTVTDEADRGDDIDGGGSFYANTGAGAEVEFRKNLGIRPRRSVVGSSGGGVGDNHHLQATPTSTSTSTPTPTYPFISFSSSSSSTPLPQQPSSSSAKPTKEMLTKDINCQQCNVPVGTLIFHGFAEALDTPHSVRVWCTSCQVFAHGAATTPASSRGGAAIHSSSLPSTPKTSEYPIMCNPLDLVSDTLSTTIPTNATDTSRPLKKKRNSKTDKFSDSNSSLLECDSCKRQVGTCVARLLPSIITSAAASSIKATDPFLDLRTRPESLEPDFGIEIICCICRDKYGFCTECGGGRKFRTGKWRPLGLFQKGRRTCMLSHARVGKSDIRHETILLPYEIANNIKADESSFQDLIKTMESLYFECKMATYGLPRFMEAVDELGTWERLRERCLTSWHACKKKMQETQLTSRVYLVLALVDPPPPRKVRKKSISDHSVNSSLSLFNKQVIVGFSLVEWNLQASTIYLCHSCQRSITSDPRTVAIDIARSAIKRVLKDSVELFASVAGVGAGGSSRASLKTDAAGPPSSSYFHCIDHIYSVTVKLEEETVFDYNENGGRGDGRSTRDSSTNTDNMLYPSSSSVRKSEVHDGESLYNRAGFMELSGYLKKHQVDPSLFPIVDSFLGGTPSARVYAAHISDVLANLEQKLNRK